MATSMCGSCLTSTVIAKKVMELSAEVHGNSDFVQDDPPLAPQQIHIAGPVENMDVDGEKSDEKYVVKSNESGSSEDDDEEEFIPETPVEASVRYLLPASQQILAFSAVPSHYQMLDLDAIHEKTSFSNTGEDDYNLDSGVQFWVGHKFKSKDVMMQSVKNYSICRSVEYQVVESHRLKYIVYCWQYAARCTWSLRVALRQNLGYWEVRKIGGAHTCLAPTMSQDHRHVFSPPPIVPLTKFGRPPDILAMSCGSQELVNVDRVFWHWLLAIKLVLHLIDMVKFNYVEADVGNNRHLCPLLRLFL
ncbi:hypothetical protein Ahy_B06g081255 [Arachis hypogaea]|uniref:Transposase MuDR plant domain-containing protein n=1 Tax=Arachis hypogaea TaxID=3818 RepID=A0A444YKT3_ARAHY|nr:hypothetical protein Ahy_B06g081255 [Arachis hypogaea]